jgi:hypothetical protein
MNRPVGVTLIGVLDFLGMLLQIGAGLVFLVGMSFAGAFISKLAADNPQLANVNITGIMAGVGVAFAIIAFVFALVSAVIGWGMLALKNWARIMSIIYSCVGILCFGLGLLLSLVHFRPFGFIWDAAWFSINGLIIWYLLQPEVKAAFAGRPRTMAATA